jgi:hypothetical protein
VLAFEQEQRIRALIKAFAGEKDPEKLKGPGSRTSKTADFGEQAVAGRGSGGKLIGLLHLDVY